MHDEFLQRRGRPAIFNSRNSPRRADVKVHRGVRHVDSSSTPIKRNRPCGSCRTCPRIRALVVCTRLKTCLKIQTRAAAKLGRGEIYRNADREREREIQEGISGVGENTRQRIFLSQPVQYLHGESGCTCRYGTTVFSYHISRRRRYHPFSTITRGL